MKPSMHSPLADREHIAAVTPLVGLFLVARQLFSGTNPSSTSV